MGCERSEGRGCAFGRDVRRSAWLLGALLSAGAVPTALRAAEMPDDGLLEFLGSVDSEDRGWHDYLARTDIDKVARRAGDGAGNPAAADGPARHKSADPPASDPPPNSSDQPVAQP